MLRLQQKGFITARKRSLRRLCFYTCLSFCSWGVVSQHALQVSRPTPRGEVEGSGLGGFQAHTWGEVEGSGLGGLQAHTQGEVERSGLRGSPGPHPGEPPGPHQGGSPACTEADTPHPQQTATAAGGTHPTGMHSCC